MSPLKRLFRVFDAAATNGPNTSDVPDAKALRRELANARRTLEALGDQVASLQRKAAQLDELRRDDASASVRMQLLEAVLNADAAGRHVEWAVPAATLSEAPLP